MQQAAEGLTADPVRLREVAGVVRARAADVDGAAATARGTLAAAAEACGGPRLAAALAAVERELSARAGGCADALRAAGEALVQTAGELEAADRLPAAGVPPDGSIRAVLG